MIEYFSGIYVGHEIRFKLLTKEHGRFQFLGGHKNRKNYKSKIQILGKYDIFYNISKCDLN